jgi:cytochrome d ubiquinol oxidase subunit I
MWMVAIGSNLSALWILIANSWMHEPVGYVVRNGRAEMTDFFALLTNPHVWVQFPHVLFAAATTAGFFILAVSAYHLVRRRDDDGIFRRSFNIGLAWALAGALLVGLVGHTQGQHMIQAQPMKMAAAEALWETEDPAAFSLISIVDEEEQRDIFSIRIPYLLSVLAYNRLEGEVRGIKDLQAEFEETYGPGDYVPPVTITFWTFRFMVGAGTLMVLVPLLGLFLVLRNRLNGATWFLGLLPWTLFLPYLANTSGWILTEVGRQPWIVYGLMRTEEGVSATVPWGTVLTSLIVYTLLYGALIVADVYLLQKFARRGPEAESDEAEAPVAL